MSWKAVSKAACARYDKTRGDMGQATFKMVLNAFIREGHQVPEAERLALEYTRSHGYPAFVPRLAPGIAA
jgi:hypothetical protein